MKKKVKSIYWWRREEDECKMKTKQDKREKGNIQWLVLSLPKIPLSVSPHSGARTEDLVDLVELSIIKKVFIDILRQMIN